MSNTICLILVIAAVQSILAGKPVQQVRVQPVIIEYNNGLTAKSGDENIGKETTYQVGEDTSAAEILAAEGIALVQTVNGDKTEHSILLPDALAKQMIAFKCNALRYDNIGEKFKPRDMKTVHVKIIISFEKCKDENYGKNIWKIEYESTEFTVEALFGNLALTLGAVNPGTFYKEMSKDKKQDQALITIPFCNLADAFLKKEFIPKFITSALNPILNQVKGKITQFTVTVSTTTGQASPLVIMIKDSDTDVTKMTLVEYAYGVSTTVDTALDDPKFTYSIDFTYTPVE